ncbi:DUF2934 domain-containing protein [Sinorhizobium fredii]|uniref:DUF2934 domain-containing protein n=1 Tax=Rhizobium fredii TaxID=380 RepID=A0A2L0H9W6_RHIFR|nr:DUF2934 domain-containing protein [Sinorhizobium fredii]AUX78301.1 hypothetical protein NXT3_PA00004 [Sinorhizobium fredii]
MKTKEELIRKRPYELWERAGRPEGDGLEYWFQAAKEIEAIGINAVLGEPDERGTAAKPKKAPKSAVRKQPDSAAPLKRRTVSKTSG